MNVQADSDRLNLQRLAQRLQRRSDAVDLGGVAQVEQARHMLPWNGKPAGKLGRTHMLREQLVEEQYLRGRTGGQLDQILAARRSGGQK
jgi:hypothetical protein